MEFKTFLLELKDDIQLVCITVTNFPKGIAEEFTKLEREFPETASAGYYGISWMAAEGQIVYKASAVMPEHYSGNTYEKYILKKGTYLSVSIENWMQKISQITDAFTFLMKTKQFRDGCHCIEWYKSDELVYCMFRLPDDEMIKL